MENRATVSGMRARPITTAFPPETYRGFTFRLRQVPYLGFFADLLEAPAHLDQYIALHSPNPIPYIPVGFGYTAEQVRAFTHRQFEADLSGQTLSQYLGIHPVYPLQEIVPAEVWRRP